MSNSYSTLRTISEETQNIQNQYDRQHSVTYVEL